MSQDVGYLRSLSAASATFGNAFSNAANATQAPEQNQTLLQRIGITVTPPSINAGAMMRDATKVAPDLVSQQQVAAAATQDCKEEFGAGERAFEQAKGVTLELAKQVAPDLGYQPGQVDATYGQNCTLTETIGTAVAGKGMGSAATHLLEGMSGLNEIHNESEKLKPDEAKAIMDEVACRINGQSSLAQTQVVMSTFDRSGPMDFSNVSFDLTDCTGDDLAELMDSRFEDQPEAVAILETLDKLEEVHENHLDVEEAHDRAGVDIHSCAIEAADLGSLTAMAPIIEARNFGVDVDGPLGGLLIKPEEMPAVGPAVAAYDNENALQRMAMTANGMG